MKETVDYFEKNGYVVLKNALTKEECNFLVEHMFKLKEEGKLVNDEQCPLSDAIYGDPIFDSILQKFAEPIGQNVGRKLLPTYTYARIYRPGEILKKHKDRPSCEISATLTLGYDAKNVWPIFFDEEKETPVSLETGELAVYKGCEVVHWRTAFKGNWHVQVFLHYVDANGPYKNHVLDGRSSLGVEKTQNVVPNNVEQSQFSQVKIKKPIYNSVILPSRDNTFPGYFCIDRNTFPELMFTKEECERIIKLTEQVYESNASIGGSTESSKIDKSIRSAKIYVLENDEENRWIYDKITKTITLVNDIHFDYEISGIIHGIQLIHYSSKEEVLGHYDWHIDSGNGAPATRKISFTAQLSDPTDYEGCELIINNHANKIVGTKEQGSIHMFPSYMEHQVTNITKGNRYALVIWIHGSRRFR